MIHELKSWPMYFDAVVKGRKTFEIRHDDRGFSPGDELLLKEYIAAHESDGNPRYTGRAHRVRVTYITDFAQRDGWVVMSIVPTKPSSQPQQADQERIKIAETTVLQLRATIDTMQERLRQLDYFSAESAINIARCQGKVTP